jgi:hypothetical protein
MSSALEIPTLADATSGVRLNFSFVGDFQRPQTPPSEARPLDAFIRSRWLSRSAPFPMGGKEIEAKPACQPFLNPPKYMLRSPILAKTQIYMDTAWQSEFRERMERFGGPTPDKRVPVSIKVRIESGCFHREHSPQAYRLIDDLVAKADKSNLDFQIHEHESGPEILIYLAVTTAGLTFAKSVVDLITAIVKARSEGIKKGDRPSDPLELIVRGHSKDGEYFEEKILRIPHDQIVTTKVIQEALAKSGKTKKKKSKKK